MAEEKRLTLSDAHDWAEFRVGDLFDVSCGKMTKVDKEGTQYPVVSACTTNNAIIGYTDYDDYITSGNCLTIGQQTAFCTYQPNDFVGTNNVVILKPIYTMNSHIGLFISNQINKEIEGKFNYGRKLSASRAIDVRFNLPVTPDGLPDYDFMENYIKQLYDDFADRVCVYTEPVEKNTDISLSDREWKEFKVGELFTFTRGKRVNKRDTEQNQGKIPLVSGGDENNAVMTYINDALASGLRLKNSCISVASYGSSGSVHYHGYKCCIHDNALALNLKNTQHDNPYVNLFMVAILKTLKKNYAYGRPVIADRYSEEIISLPVTTDGQPDYDFMEQYIKSLPFSKALEI